MRRRPCLRKVHAVLTGTITYATQSGLGRLARSFYEHGLIDDVFVIEHPHFPRVPEWYPEAPSTTRHQPDRRAMTEWALAHDVMLFFETPFIWDLVAECRSHGVYTVIMPMYEWMPAITPSEPDLWLCPSLLDLQYYPQGTFVPVPTEVPWSLRKRARVFVHNGGYLGARYRNGTLTVLKALPLVRSPIRLILRAQNQEVHALLRQTPGVLKDPRLDLTIGIVPEDELLIGDVCLRPEKFNGLSLPLQEAACAGLLCMTTNRFPMNTWLPTDPLIPVESIQQVRVAGTCHEIDECFISPKVLAEHIDRWYDRDITDYSAQGEEIASRLSWSTLLPIYQRLLNP